MIFNKYFFILFFFSLLRLTDCSAQNKDEINSARILIKDYPEGIYATFEDFLNKKGVNLGSAIERREIIGFNRKVIDRNAEADQVYFYNNRNNSKITNYFAVSYNGNLYIQQRQIEKLASKEDKNQDGDSPNSYHRVLKDGNFLYMEVPFANAWSKGFAYGSGGAVGGVIGASLNKLKGVVFDLELKKFNLIRDCGEMNLLLEKYNVEKIECKGKKIDILSVRENIDKIIK